MSSGDREVGPGGDDAALAAAPAAAEGESELLPSPTTVAEAHINGEGGRLHTNGAEMAESEEAARAAAAAAAGAAAGALLAQEQQQRPRQRLQQRQSPSPRGGPRRWTEGEASAFFRALSRGSGCALGTCDLRGCIAE